jgi:hypothetical protein
MSYLSRAQGTYRQASNSVKTEDPNGGPDSIFLSKFYDGKFRLDFITLTGANGLKLVM